MMTPKTLTVAAILVVYLMRPGKAVVEIAEKTDTVIGVEGEDVNLPCDINPPSTDDEVALVLWYKDESTTPFYSLDSRRRGLYQAKHAPAPEMSGRAYLIMTQSPSLLKIDRLRAEDEGEYRCRVDFRIARSRNVLVILEIIIPPKTPVITSSKGEILQRVSGPHDVGSKLLLKCEVEGGKPVPSVTWWRDSLLLDDTYQVHNRGVVQNDLVIPSLERSDLHGVFTCQASNNNISVPVSASVTVDMNLPPVEVQIEDKNRPLSANKPVELVCRAGGSRPPANITWTIVTSPPPKGSKEKISSEGNITIGKLTFTPKVSDKGKNITCRAENTILPGSAISDEWQIDVHYVPQLSLRLGSKLRHTHIQEGKDVYLECLISANPSVTDIGWRFEGKELHTNKSSGIIVSNQSLVLQQVKRNNRGKYTCTAENSEGRGESAALYLRVQYSPVCRPDQKVLYGVARHEPVKVTCEIEADPERANFTWKFNNSAESMDLMSFASEDKRSIATYIPRLEFDYGTLLCWGRNSVGVQKEPCVFTVIPAGPPDALQNCSVSNQTEDSLMVRCQEGYDGGLQQNFVLEVYDADHNTMYSNITNVVSTFVIYDLPPGTSFVILLHAYNSKGRSPGTIIRTSTLATPESLTQRGIFNVRNLFVTDDQWQSSFSPILIVLICVIIVLVLVALGIILVMKARNRNEAEKDRKKHGNDKSTMPLRQDMDDRREIMATVIETEDKCPDVIPGVEMTTESIKVCDSHKPDIHNDNISWETRLVNSSNQAFSSADYTTNTWSMNQRPLLKQVPSPSVPQLPDKGVHLPQMATMRDYSQPPNPILSPQSSSLVSQGSGRAEWTLPRATNKLKNRQTDV